MSDTTTEERVIQKIRLRRIAGLKKYGVTMERADLSRKDWLVHAQEEAMDLAIYLERLITDEQQPAPAIASAKKRACNRHLDCDEADAQAKKQDRPRAEHCNDDCCPDCFGQ